MPSVRIFGLARKSRKTALDRRGRGLSSAAFRGVDWEKSHSGLAGLMRKILRRKRLRMTFRSMKRPIAACFNRKRSNREKNGERKNPETAMLPARTEEDRKSSGILTMSRVPTKKNRSNPDSIGGGKWTPIEPARWGEEESDRGDGFHACVETSEANPYSDDAHARVFPDLFMA